MPTQDPEFRLWRTLIRIEEIHTHRDCVYVVIPGWNPDKCLELTRKEVGEKFSLLKDGMRVYARVNIGHECSSFLRFENWEVPEFTPVSVDKK